MVDNKDYFDDLRVEVPSVQVEQERKLTKLDILRKLSSGTELREGLDNIVSGGLGALIVVSNLKVHNIFQGGFRVNCKFNSKKLAELAKMDGAIILSEDFSKILHANALLIPDNSLSSFETGVRHQAAERASKQTNALVIAVSQRKKGITIYYGNSKYVLQPTEALLRRATETLQILEKQREVFNELLINQNVLEITNLVSVSDVCRILQRMEMIKKMANIINEYILELGKDGVILRMRMRELIRGIEKEETLIVRDYLNDFDKTKKFFDELNFEEILDLESIVNFLFDKPSDESISSKGYRILSKTLLNKEDIENLISEFGNLNEILNTEELERVLGDRTENFKKDFLNLKEQIMIGKSV